jgi:hypothetical protein
MDIEVQYNRHTHNLKFVLFPFPDHCRGGMFDLRCDMEEEAALVVKNTHDGRSRHICSWPGYMTVHYVYA